MEKVGDSQSSSGPVVPTSNEKMKRRWKRVLKVEAAEPSEICLEKIKGVLAKLRETGDIDTWCEETDGMVMVLGYFDPEKLRMELENEAGDAIKSIAGVTNIIHGTASRRIQAKNPRMPIPEFGDQCTEILYHSEKPMEHSNNSQWRSRGVMANDLERGDATGSEFPKIPTAEVSDNPEKIMESSKKQCSIL